MNNTGHPAKGALLDLSIDDWQNGGDLVLMNVIRMAKIVTPIMKKQGGGAIINISTFAAFEPSLSFPISSVMRTALASYSKLYAQEFGPDNIRMNNILPGYIESYPVTEEIKSQIPLARAGKVSEIGETAVFLASQGAAYITGENIKVDGGITKNI
jgi:NAD(P)-dependent dehydrogenase (short-subunit alcohol dehydrogenase family)